MIPAVLLPLLALMASSVNAGPIHAPRDGAPPAPAALGALSPPKPPALPPVPRAPDMGMVPPPRRQAIPKDNVVVDTQPLRASVGGDAANVDASEHLSSEKEGPPRGKNLEEVKVSGGKDKGEKNGLSVGIARAALTGSDRRGEPSDEGNVGVSVELTEVIMKLEDILGTATGLIRAIVKGLVAAKVSPPETAPVYGMPSVST